MDLLSGDSINPAGEKGATQLPQPTPDDHKGRRILSLVFKTIILGTLQDLFNGTVGVLWRYLKHLALCLHYFWSPDIDRPPFDRFDFKRFCKHSFEGVVVTLIFSIFMAKAGWFAATSEELKEEMSSSDLIQMGYEAMAFTAFAISYFLLILLSLITGRIIRLWLTPEVTRKESDILMITFFNAFTSLTALTALVIRVLVRFEENDITTIYEGMIVILFFTCLLLTILWSIRFMMLNKIRGFKTILFFFLSVIIYTVMFTIGGFATTILLYIV